MKIERMWCVVDPGPVSEIVDICFEASPSDLVAGVVGAHMSGRERLARYDTLTIYTDEAEARADAEQRIAARAARTAPSTSASTCRVWELFSGQVRLFESGDVQTWDAEAGRWYPGLHVDDRMSAEDAARDAEWKAAAEAYRARPPTGATEPR